MATTTLQQAITAIKLGHKETGKRLLTQVLQASPQDETAWLWLAYAVDSDKQRRECLERVLSINPAHERARRGLATLGLSAPSLILSSPQANHSSASPAATCLKASSPIVPSLPAVEPVALASSPASEANSISPEKAENASRPKYLPLPWTIACLLITLAIIIGANLIERWQAWSQLAQSGVTTRATVIDTRTERDAYYVTYSFAAAGSNNDLTRFEKEERVRQELYNLLEPGSLIKVQYLFEQPAVV
ncbi:MAG TPA: hypothetical protein VEC93_19490, partial [Anaerolineae bacterium]|nr:hypothetical protein [Anaerolineae bacterium]